MPSTDPVPAGPSLAGRFAAAIALTIGFYLLALVLAGGLLAVAILPWVFDGAHNIWLTVTAFVLGVSILVAIVPRRLRFQTPGLKVTRDDQERLVDLVAAEAEAAGEPLPDDIYLTLEANAAVTQASRTRRVLIVGVPLLHILSERELRGVIAHEFGHYSGGDTRLGPWIYRTRETIGRTIGQLSSEDDDESWSQRAVRQPFIWYGHAFLRITAAISRRQEFAADACAVRSVGRAAHVAALERIHTYAPGFDAYWQQEVIPVLQTGRRPPVSEGFRRFIAHESTDRVAREQLAFMREQATDPYDSHPSLPERIAAVEGMPDGEPDDSPTGIALLASPDEVERRLLDFLLGDEAGELRPVDWQDVGAEVYAERARHLTGEFPRVLDGVTVGGLAEAVEAIPQVAEALRLAEVSDHPAELVAAVLGDGVLLALASAGWTIEAEPAEPISARRGDFVLLPHGAVADLSSGELSAGAWRAQAEELGIASLPLAAEIPAGR